MLSERKSRLVTRSVNRLRMQCIDGLGFAVLGLDFLDGCSRLLSYLGIKTGLSCITKPACTMLCCSRSDLSSLRCKTYAGFGAGASCV